MAQQVQNPFNTYTIPFSPTQLQNETVTPEVAASLRAVLEDPSSVDVADLDQLFSDCKTTSVFMGTTVQHGHGKGLVVATGMNTEFGKTFQEMKNVEQRKTPLQVLFFKSIFYS